MTGPAPSMPGQRRTKRRGFIKRMVPPTLFARSLMIMMTPVLLLQIITIVVFFDRHWDKMTGRLAYAVAGEISALAQEIEQDYDAARFRRITGYAAQNLSLLVSFEEGATLERKESFYVNPWASIMARTLSRELEDRLRAPYTLFVGDEEKYVEVSLQLSRGVLHVSLPQRRMFSSSGYIFLLWMMGSSVILFAVATLFMRNQIRPIRRLAVAAERFGRGRDVPYFKAEGASEVRQAAEAFLQMHERVKRQIAQRTAMLAGVSHDLRTPLTRMKLQLAMMGHSPDVEALKGDVLEMERMINGYLDFARGEGGEQASRASLASIIDRVAGAARRLDRTVHVDCPEDIQVTLRPVAFERALSNLVSNASNYADTIWVEAIRQGDEIVLTVDDNGPGIDEALYDEVFKPFYRVDGSRNKARGGVGLGLPVTMDIVHAHGGRIWLERSPHGGLRVNITVPQ